MDRKELREILSIDVGGDWRTEGRESLTREYFEKDDNISLREQLKEDQSGLGSRLLLMSYIAKVEGDTEAEERWRQEWSESWRLEEEISFRDRDLMIETMIRWHARWRELGGLLQDYREKMMAEENGNE